MSLHPIRRQIGGGRGQGGGNSPIKRKKAKLTTGTMDQEFRSPTKRKDKTQEKEKIFFLKRGQGNMKKGVSTQEKHGEKSRGKGKKTSRTRRVSTNFERGLRGVSWMG